MHAAELSPFVSLLFSIRELPAKLLGRSGDNTSRERDQKPFLAQMLDDGFGLLAETEQEIVFGLIGKFWALTGGEEIEISGPQFFRDFDRTDFAKTAANLMVRADGDKTILSTETRIWSPDKRTRRKFTFYWRLISFASGWIRVMWLNAIKRRAERKS
jgi:hypothetical protein